MNLNTKVLPDLRHMRTFVAVVETNGFSSASEKLFMTQPGVSLHIQKLEETLGFILLERYPRKIILTPSGTQFYKFCLEMFEQMADTLDTIDLGVVQVYGWLKIATPGSFGRLLLLHLSKLKIQYPLLKFSVQFQPNEVILRELTEGRIDVGFVTEEINDESFKFEQIIDEEVVIFTSRHNEQREICSLSALNELPFIDYPDRRQLLANWVSHHFNKPSFNQNEINFQYFVNNLEAVIQLVANQQGASIIPFSAINTHALNNEFILLNGIQTIPLKQSIFLTTRSNQNISRRINILKNSFHTDPIWHINTV